jgi:hypothetical protein
MAAQETYLLKFNADTGEFTQAVEKATDKVKELKVESSNTGQSGRFAFGLLDQATGGLAGKVKQSVDAVKGLNIGLRGTKAAIAATGIGLLIVAVGELIANFDKISEFFRDKTREGSLKREAELMERQLDVSRENLELANIQKKSSQDIFALKESILKNEETQLEREIAIKHEQGDQEAILELQKNLRQKQLDIVLLQATAEQDLQDILEESKRINDEGYAASKAREESVKKEQDALRAVSREVGGLQAAIQMADAEISKYTEGTEAHAKAVAFYAEQRAKDEASLLPLLEQQAIIQEAVNKKLAAYDEVLEGGKAGAHQRNLERIAEEKAAELALRAELLQDDLDSLQEEQDYMDASADIMMESFSAGQSIEAQKREEFLKTNQLFTELIENQTEIERAAAEASQQLIDSQAAARAAAFKGALDTAKSSLDALASLNDAFTGDSEAQKKKGFERSKKIQIAQALIGTYESATSAFGSLASIPIVGPALGAVAAAGAVVAGLANVKKIKSTTFSGGGGDQSNSYSGIGDTASGPPTPTAPQLDLSFLGGGAGQTGFRTYVIASEVSNSQQANQKINDQAALVG